MVPGTKFYTNDPLTRKRWAKDLFSILLAHIEYGYLVGTSDDSPVQLNTDLGKGEGDNVTFGVLKPLVGEGTVGDEEVEGNEEKLRFADFKVTIEERNHAVDTGGRMEEQRVPYNLVQKGKNALADWWANDVCNLLINTLASNTNYKVKGSYFANDIVAPDARHMMTVNDTAEASITSADTVNLSFLDAVKQRAEMMDKEGANHWKVRPLKLKGKNYYRVLMNNYMFDGLRQNVNTAQWGDILRNAQKLAFPEVEIEYNGMLVTKTERLPNMYPSSVDSRAGVYRGCLLGAQAACYAWGGAGDSKGTAMNFHQYTRDADRFIMVRGGGIHGVKKTRFDGIDYGCITFAGWGEPLST